MLETSCQIHVTSLNPQDAAELGLSVGDEAEVSNEIGKLFLQVRISEDLPKGVALSPKGRWPKSEPGNANVNALNSGVKTDMGESTAVHGVENRGEAGHPEAFGIE